MGKGGGGESGGLVEDSWYRPGAPIFRCMHAGHVAKEFVCQALDGAYCLEQEQEQGAGVYSGSLQEEDQEEACL